MAAADSRTSAADTTVLAEREKDAEVALGEPTAAIVAAAAHSQGSSGPQHGRAAGLLPDINMLKEEQARTRAERRQNAHEFKNDDTRRSNLKRTAKQLSDAVLYRCCK
jgi:hypothetical protein